MTSSSSWQGHPSDPAAALLEPAAALPLQGNLPASGGEMPVLRLAVDTAPASLRETILQEVRTHHVQEVLNSHTHKRPMNAGGPVCGPLESLFDTWWDKHMRGYGCSLHLDASFKKGDGKAVGPLQVEGMPSR